MKRIYAPESLLEAELLLAMLASEGVTAHLAGRALVGGIGDLPAMGLLQLTVPDEHAERARELIDQYTSARVLPGEEPEGGPGVLLC